MASRPSPPTRTYSFEDHSNALPTTPQPGNQIDQEIDRSNDAIAQLISWAAGVINDTGTGLKPGIEVPGLIGPQGPQGIQGPQGPQGQPFYPDALGLFSTRSTYDTAAANFSFLATDQSKLYFKLSNAAGDWSAGVTFPGTTHTHQISDVTGLQAALDAKAPASHTHTIANTTGLQAVLDNKLSLTEVNPQTVVSNIAITKAYPQFCLNKPASGSNNSLIGSTGGKINWHVIPGNFEAMVGSNTGSNFVIERWDDAGNFITTAVYIRRSDGKVGINNANPQYMLDVNGNGRFKGDLQVEDGNVSITANNPSLNLIRKAENQSNLIYGRRIDGKAMWHIELGTWSGDNFTVSRYDASGNFVDTPFMINQNGSWAINGDYGTSGKLLMTNGTTAKPSWAAPSDILGFGAMWESPAQTITLGGGYALSHNLGRIPKLVQFEYECITAEAGFSAGQRIMVCGAPMTYGLQPQAYDATNISFRMSNAGFYLLNAGTGALTSLTPGNWRWRARVWA